MAKYIKRKDGKLAGSIGDGKSNIPTSSTHPSLARTCANCGNITHDWHIRQWETVGEAEYYCGACLANETALAERLAAGVNDAFTKFEAASTAPTDDLNAAWDAREARMLADRRAAIGDEKFEAEQAQWRGETDYPTFQEYAARWAAREEAAKAAYEAKNTTAQDCDHDYEATDDGVDACVRCGHVFERDCENCGTTYAGFTCPDCGHDPIDGNDTD